MTQKGNSDFESGSDLKPPLADSPGRCVIYAAAFFIKACLALVYLLLEVGNLPLQRIDVAGHLGSERIEL